MNEEIYSNTSESTPSSVPTEPVTGPVPPIPFSPKRSSIASLFLGVLLVLLATGFLGTGYYIFKIRSDLTASPTPIPTVSPSPLASPSPEAEQQVVDTVPLSTRAPSTPSKKIVIPTSTPTPLTSFDIRFGNPSANVKQTYDDGSGTGRVINREYTSIQAGQFDEMPSSWNPNVTACFHIVANDTIPGANVKYSLQVDGVIVKNDTFAQYDKLEAGRLYDLCYGTNTSIGKHSLVLLLNGDTTLKESNYVNDLGRIDYENLADNVAPNFTLVGPFDWKENGTCLLTQSVSDNVNTISQLKVEQKIDTQDWSPLTGGQYCFSGTKDSSHNYSVRITDTRGNKNEQAKTFVLY